MHAMETSQLARVVLVFPKVRREFSMGVASVADSSGTVASGVAAIFIHSYVNCPHDHMAHGEWTRAHI